MKDVGTHECLFRVGRSLAINVEPYGGVYFHEHFNPICGPLWPLLCYLDGKIYIKEKFTYGDECSWQEEQGYDRDDLHRDGLNLCFPCNIVHICGP